jgi:hypothetical protein
VAERRGVVVVEVVRLAIVLLLLTVGYVAGPATTDLVAGVIDDPDPVEVRFLTSLLGALIGYVLGGVTGRMFVTEVDRAEERLRQIEAPVFVAGVLGALAGGVFGLVILWPIALLPGRAVTVPLAITVLVILVYSGGRLGAARGGDLLRFVGARGRFEVSTPAWGGKGKLVDTSVLIDGRVIDVLRTGFLEGPLIVPRFVLTELQGLADTEDRRRRNAGRRGLDTLAALQDEGLTPVEITDDDPVGGGGGGRPPPPPPPAAATGGQARTAPTAPPPGAPPGGHPPRRPGWRRRRRRQAHRPRARAESGAHHGRRQPRPRRRGQRRPCAQPARARRSGAPARHSRGADQDPDPEGGAGGRA